MCLSYYYEAVLSAPLRRGGSVVARGQKKQRSMALYEAILKLRDLDECCRFFDDLCTPTELRSMEQRFDVATYLLEDQVYLEILEKTGASSATISRVRRNILDNETGGAMREIILREGFIPQSKDEEK
ncbi:MAG: TrpR-like protein [Clostridia bacterium]|nr:TrpR-like protein [Clostridia bacterium]MBR5384211.1 TrpR-like protein [Clostridia bacterium]